MHRINYDGFVTESGLRRFIDQADPGTPGTILGGQWLNAVQEEIAGVITASGGALEPDPSHDRAAGWGQLAHAIFGAGAIGSGGLAINGVITSKIADGAVTDAKIASMSLSKLTAGQMVINDDVTGGNHRRWEADLDRETRWRIETGAGNLEHSIIRDMVTARSTHRAYLPGTGTGYTSAVDVRPEGILYYDDPNNSGATYTDPIKKAVLPVSLSGWVEVAPGYFQKEVASKIPKTRKLFDAVAAIKTPAGGIYDGDCYIWDRRDGANSGAGNCYKITAYRTTGSAFWTFTVRVYGAPGSMSDCRVLVTYAGA